MTASAESPAARAQRGGVPDLRRGGVPGPQRGRVPDFFIVGHAKCGTTALYEMLRGHPQIYMPDLKEPAFFASDMRARFQRPSSGPLPQTLAEYLSLFAAARPEQLVGEASSSYIVSRTAAHNIAEVQPGARAIVILREPASFLRSLHLQLLQNHIETQKDFRKALALESARRQGRRIPRGSPRPQALLYSERVRYVEQLRRYRERFSPERVLVLIYDDFRRENEATVRRVLRFLGVDDTLPIATTEANPTVRVRSQQLDDLVHKVSVGRGPVSRAVKASLKTVTSSRLRRAALRATRRHVVVGEPPPPDEDFMLELRRRFRSEVEALSGYLDRDLVTLWGYDRL
ncbi:MAG: sulfotransferase family protein [Solirubrobacterales bacterium]